MGKNRHSLSGLFEGRQYLCHSDPLPLWLVIEHTKRHRFIPGLQSCQVIDDLNQRFFDLFSHVGAIDECDDTRVLC